MQPTPSVLSCHYRHERHVEDCKNQDHHMDLCRTWSSFDKYAGDLVMALIVRLDSSDILIGSDLGVVL